MDSDKPTDALGRELKEGNAITYASTEGRSAVLRFAVIEKVQKNKVGIWKLKVMPIYDPGSYHSGGYLDKKTKCRSIEAKSKVFLIDMAEGELRDHVKRLDAISRLNN